MSDVWFNGVIFVDLMFDERIVVHGQCLVWRLSLRDGNQIIGGWIH